MHKTALAFLEKNPRRMIAIFCDDGTNCERGSGEVQGSGFRVQGSGFRVEGSGFRVQGSGLKVEGLGFRV